MSREHPECPVCGDNHWFWDQDIDPSPTPDPIRRIRESPVFAYCSHCPFYVKVYESLSEWNAAGGKTGHRALEEEAQEDYDRLREALRHTPQGEHL